MARKRQERRCQDCGTTDETRFRPTRCSRCSRCDYKKRNTSEYKGLRPRNHREGCKCRYCGETHGRPHGDDLTKLAGDALFPGISYEAIERNRAMRILTDEWARQEARRRNLAGFGGQRPGREKAA